MYKSILINLLNNIVISGYHKKLIYSNFMKWVDKNDALRGFDLTEKLMQEIFSDLDPHKKGYVTEDDWINAFSNFVIF